MIVLLTFYTYCIFYAPIKVPTSLVYAYFIMKDYEDLICRGVLLQLNFLSLIGYYSEGIKKKTEELIANDMVSFVGSDCHNINHAELYKECQTKKAWHDLNNRGKLLNSTL